MTHRLSHLAGAMTQNYSPGDPLVAKEFLCTPPGDMALLGDPPPVTLSWGYDTEYSPGDPLVAKEFVCTPPGDMALLGDPPPVTLSWGYDTQLLTW